MTTPSVIDRIGAERIILDLLGDRKIKNGLTNCINPAHDDEHPSMSVDPKAGVFNCFACGVHGGCYEMAVLRGIGRDHAEAAKALDEKYGGSTNGNSHHPPRRTEEPWPYYPNTAKGLGWELLAEHGFRKGRDPAPGLSVPTWEPDGSPARTKIRGPRDENDDVRADFLFDADNCGLINWPAVLDHLAGCESPSSAMVAGETDLLAWTWACKAEGIEIPAFSLSTGEGSTIAPEYAEKLRGTTVHLFGDNDPTGQASLRKNAARLREHGVTVIEHFPPAPHKDVRDFIGAGGKARELLRVEEKPAPLPTSWDLTDIVTEPDPPPAEEFVDQVFARPSFNVVFGPPSAGKSWAIMALLVDACCLGGEGGFMGDPDLEINSTAEDVALWIFGSEDTEARVKRRLRCLWQGQKTPPLRGKVITATLPPGVLLNTPEGWKWLEDMIVQHKATIVALDTIASLTGGTLDVNKAEQVAPFIGKILELRARRRLVIFALHHTRKAGQDTKRGIVSHADAMLGAQTWRALSDGCLMLDANDGDTSQVTIRLVKGKDIDHPIPSLRFTLVPGSGRFRPLKEEETPPAREKGTGGRPSVFTLNAILALRDSHPEGVEWADLPKLLNGKKSTFRNRSAKLQEALLELDHVVLAGVLKWGTHETVS